MQHKYIDCPDQTLQIMCGIWLGPTIFVAHENLKRAVFVAPSAGFYPLCILCSRSNEFLAILFLLYALSSSNFFDHFNVLDKL